VTPREKAARLYHLWHQPRDFEADVLIHQTTGYVIETASEFLMGRPVDHQAPEEFIKSPRVIFGKTVADAWFIWIFVGDLRMVEKLAPYPLPWVGWSRRNRSIRWYDFRFFGDKVNEYLQGNPAA
jgi:hypothetical protein